MKWRTSLAATLFAVGLMAGSCRGSATPGVTPVRELPSAVTAATPTPVAPVSTGDMCPVSDESLCAAAVELRTAARANDIDYFVRRLSITARDCTVGPSSCPLNESGTPVPGVALFNYGSDCCYVSTQQFRDGLATLLSRAKPGSSDGAGAGDWNLFGVLSLASFWRSKTAVVLTAVFDGSERWIIEVGTDHVDGRWEFLGAIKGPIGTYYKFPEAELHRW